MKKIIIFGGTFDPVHKGHIEIANKALKKIKADKLFFVPCNTHPDQKQINATCEQRLDMLYIATQKNLRFDVSDFELKRHAVSYSVDTVSYFQQNYSDCELYFLIGQDQLNQFKNWHGYETILEKAKIISHIRKNNLMQPQAHIDFPYIKLGGCNIKTSSTQLRIKPNKKYLDPKVIKYINDFGVYAYLRCQQVMSEYRLLHCQEVANIAKNLAKIHKLYPLINKAYVAGFYHDYGKEFDKELQEKIAKKLKIKNYVSWKVLHSYVSAYFMEKNFFMNDYQVLTAVKSHTVPYDYATLSKIIFIADKVATRDDEAKELRKKWIELAHKNLNAAFDTINNFYIDYYKRNKV
ncbi:MAG: nicotinate-nucleotide adenylyltransferase [Malacoplasma sp.]|nr:nicotinate-nucleotide adenylyltransferase [Malacoplasma sp.]